MTEEEITGLLLERFGGLQPTEAWGETGFFYNPGSLLKRGVYFATLKSRDGENDKASRLDRDGVFRFNIGTPATEYQRLFGKRPSRPAKGGVVTWNGIEQHDFSALDTIMPHPVYAWMGWVCVLNPSEPTWATCQPLLDSAYQKARRSFRKRVR